MLAERLQILRSEKNRLKQQVLRDQRATDRLLQEAFVLYVLTGCAMDAPTEFMKRYASTFSGDLRTDLEKQLLQKPVEELAKFDCTDGNIRPAVSQTAQIFFKEWQLAQWVSQVNEHAATAPGYSDIAAHKGSLDPHLLHSHEHGVANTGTVRKWIGRWRRKWNGKLGRVRTQCGGDVEKVSGKAGVLKRFNNLKKVIRLGPKVGPFSGPKSEP